MLGKSNNSETDNNKAKSPFPKQFKALRRKRYESDPDKFRYCKTQESFSEEMDVGRGTIISWEKGTTFPDADQFFKICDALECDMNYLFGLQKNPIQSAMQVSDYIGIEYENVERLLRDNRLVEKINFLLHSQEFLNLCRQIDREEICNYLEKDLLDKFSEKFMEMINEAYQNAVAHSTPFEDMLPVYGAELKKIIPQSKREQFIADLAEHISADYVEQIHYAAQDKGIAQDTAEYFNLIIKMVAEFTIDSLRHYDLREYTMARLSQCFLSIIEDFIEQQNQKRREALKLAAKNWAHNFSK